MVACRRDSLICAAAIATGAISASARARQDSQTAKPEDQSPGKQLFEQRCSTCHGLDAGGAMGPNIQGVPFRLGADPVKAVIKNGMGGGGMPAFAGQLDDAQIQQIVDYLLTLQRKDSTPITGDPGQGQRCLRGERLRLLPHDRRARRRCGA